MGGTVEKEVAAKSAVAGVGYAQQQMPKKDLRWPKINDLHHQLDDRQPRHCALAAKHENVRRLLS